MVLNVLKKLSTVIKEINLHLNVRISYNRELAECMW